MHAKAQAVLYLYTPDKGLFDYSPKRQNKFWCHQGRFSFLFSGSYILQSASFSYKNKYKARQLTVFICPQIIIDPTFWQQNHMEQAVGVRLGYKYRSCLLPTQLLSFIPIDCGAYFITSQQFHFFFLQFESCCS